MSEIHTNLNKASCTEKTSNGNHEYTYTSDSNSSENSKTINPVTHRVKSFFHVPNISLYRTLISVFKSGRSEFRIQDKDYTFYSAFNSYLDPHTNKPSFQYRLTALIPHQPSKISLIFKPFFGKGTPTAYGKTQDFNKVGVDIEVESSYYDTKNQLDFINDFLKQIDATRFSNMIEPVRIMDFERHVRYSATKEPLVRDLFDIIKEVSDTRSVIDKTNHGDTFMYTIESPEFDKLGFNFPEYIDYIKIKSYRFDGYENRSKDDYLVDPKLEVVIHSKERIPAGEEEKIISLMDEFLYNLIHWSGLTNDDFVEDLYFKKEFKERVITYKPSPTITELTIKPMELKQKIPLQTHHFNILPTLYYLTLHGCMSVRDLSEQLDIPLRTMWGYIENLKLRGLVETINSYGTQVSFSAEKDRKIIRGVLESILSYTPQDVKSIIKKVKKPFRKDPKLSDLLEKETLDRDSKPVNDIIDVIVNSVHEASELSKFYRERGIKKRILLA